MNEAATVSQKAKTGRPSHVVWVHFIRGEKRNRFHHHVYCRYCSHAQAAGQTMENSTPNPPSVESIRGVPDTMLRHLSICGFCPSTIRVEMRLMLAQHRAKQRQSKAPRHCSAATAAAPLLDDILLIEDGDKSTPSSSHEGHPSIDGVAPALSNLAMAQVAWGGSVPPNWLWNEDMQPLLPAALSLPSPDLLYAMASSDLSMPRPLDWKVASGFWTLSITTWRSVCTREFTVACSLVEQQQSAQPSKCTGHTLSIVSIPETVDALTAHLTEILEGAPQDLTLLGLVCNSALGLRAARAAVAATARRPLPSLLCCTSILRLVAAHVFLNHKHAVREILFGPRLSGAMPSRRSWSTWVDAILEAKVLHPLTDACTLLHVAFRAAAARPFSVHDLVSLLLALRQHGGTVADVVDAVWATYDEDIWPWLVLSMALHISSPPVTTDVHALQWVSLGTYAQTLARQWQLHETQLTSDLQAFKEQRFPFDATITAAYAHNAPAFYSFLSDPSPTFHAFCARLYSLVPQTLPLESYVAGLDMGGLDPSAARVDTPVHVLRTTVRFQQAMEEKSPPPPCKGKTSFGCGVQDLATVWYAEEWESLCDDVDGFLTTERAELMAGADNAPAVSLQELYDCFHGARQVP
ncbi:Aste57867_3934 [Aphanomyces stellatus]|uniref:Aste57867_3934 protein n=1 Tax=Aphanomyces stellatus TaxID=120398 RepID=A0A485KD02_9STRA|nr:hypothetical protein As57867_003923 [Aphanomyces stellatus]VFT81071.1 Aste57867_3934 [Aphanomyces stellatus]